MGAIGEGGYRVLDPALVLTGPGSRPRNCTRWSSASARSSRTGLPASGGGVTGSTCTGASRWSSTTGSRPARPPAPPARWRAHLGAARSCWRSRWRPPEDHPRWPGADDIVCVFDARGPSTRWGSYYRDFPPTTDDEVMACWTPPADARCRTRPRRPADCDADVEIPVGRRRPARAPPPSRGPGGVVVFAHGSGSSRHSPRNRLVAAVLHRRRPRHPAARPADPGRRSATGANVFDIELLAGPARSRRPLARAAEPDTAALPIGYFGASTGAGGRAVGRRRARRPASPRSCPAAAGPTWPAPRLGEVTAPTLLIVGGADPARARAQPAGPGAAALPEPARGRAGRHPPVRGAGHARGGGRLARDWFTASPAAAEAQDDRGTAR